MELILSLIAGALGGNVAGGLGKSLTLSTIGNSLAGILGGGLAAQALAMLGARDLSQRLWGADIGEIGAIMGPFLAGALGGALVLLIIGTIRRLVVR